MERGVTVINIIFFLSHVRPPPTRLSQLIEVQLIVQEREGKERECVLSLLQKLAYSSVWNPPPKISLAKVWRVFLAS